MIFVCSGLSRGDEKFWQTVGGYLKFLLKAKIWVERVQRSEPDTRLFDDPSRRRECNVVEHRRPEGLRSGEVFRLRKSSCRRGFFLQCSLDG